MNPLEAIADNTMPPCFVPTREAYVAMAKALRSAEGYLLNAKVDLETGAPKRTAIATIDGGLRMIRSAFPPASLTTNGEG